MSLKKLKIYIASSWRNQHGVEMLTDLLRKEGHTVISWIENNFGETHNHTTKKFVFDDWVRSEESDQSFSFDVKGAMFSDLFIYYGPAGKDAMAEMGAAFGNNVNIVGLFAKGEEIGLMSKMVRHWFDRYTDLLNYVKDSDKFDNHQCKFCKVWTTEPDRSCYANPNQIAIYK